MNRAVCMLAKWLVERSARILIQDSERYAEQWLADLEDRKTPLRKLVFALGLVRATRVLRRESAFEQEVSASSAHDAALWLFKLEENNFDDTAEAARFVGWLKQSREHRVLLAQMFMIQRTLQDPRFHEELQKMLAGRTPRANEEERR